MLIIFFIQMALATPGSSLSNEKEIKSIIQRAQTYILQQNKAQAIQTLTDALEKEKNKKNKEYLLGNLNKIGDLFLTDKAQKIFEQGNFLFKNKPTEALAKYQEAFREEPLNFKIILNLGRTYLSLGQCSEANKTSIDKPYLNLFNEEGFLLYIQSKTCMHNLDGLEQEINAHEVTRTDIQFQMLLVQAQIQFFKQQYYEALKYIQKAIKQDRGFPESYYWENQILEKLNKPSTDSAKQYVKYCKTISKFDQNRFKLEPRLCLEYKTLEKLVVSVESKAEREVNE